ncbi:carboxymuconolactone decarboxylase family protein [Aldersonia kunmingensis]|uniref:carboxymuconolactone decarboxylase family protein n=1 Tax=Aldersonia kunmingensis TaxID=408066 RepID=UPI00082BE331|nr:carboxymuconolactone decarboxylase family protein [Aldersonia kunmingensis]
MSAPDTGSNELPEDARERGLVMMDRVYGPGYHKLVPPEAESFPSAEETVKQLFGQIWSRPGLPLRDRRLVVMGATAMLGRADLLETQVRGALLSGDLNADELREIVLQLHYYVGWPNATAIMSAVEKVIREG